MEITYKYWNLILNKGKELLYGSSQNPLLY